MTWPQIYVLVMMVLGCVLGPIARAYDKRYSSMHVAAYSVALTVGQVVFAWVLHKGGFW